MEDITPQLIQQITEEFRRTYAASVRIQELLGKVKQKTATYAEAQQYAIEVSRLIGNAYEKYISSATLPDGKMYYNIASRLIPETLDENHKLVSEYAADVQAALNKKANIGLKVQTAELDKDRVDGLVEMASNADQYDDVSGKLISAFENFSQHIVDETIQRNAEFQYNSGMKPKIYRKAEWKCCEWCQMLAGEYDYPDVPDDLYRRHERCRCTVEYDPGDGRRQNVHTKKWTDQEKDASIKLQKQAPTQETATPEYHRQGVTRARNSQLPNGLPIEADPDAVIDKIDDLGKVLQRRVYGADGKAMIDYDTSDHGMSAAHPTGAHRHMFDYSKKNPHGKPLPLEEEELEINADIIRRGENYFD